jgi:hypothetical protein
MLEEVRSRFSVRSLGEMWPYQHPDFSLMALGTLREFLQMGLGFDLRASCLPGILPAIFVLIILQVGSHVFVWASLRLLT